LWDGDKTAVSQVLDKCFKDDEIKTVLSFSQLLYGVPPSQCSFMFHCCCAGIMQESVWKIKGGAMTFVKAAQAALLSKGAKLFTNKKVVKISVEKNKKILFFEDGDAISADIAVSSIAPKEFIKIMPEGTYRKAAIERIQSAKDTIGFFTLYGAAKEDLRYENINSLAAAKKQDYLSDFKDAFYVNFQDKGAVCAAMSVNSEEKFWDIPKDRYIEIKERYSAELKNKISQNWSGLLDKIDFLESSAPATMKRYVNYYGAYGFKHSLDSVNIAPITKTPGLYLIGQAVVTPGLLGAMISSFLLDKIIFNRDGSK
jgi:phytoene dehydrogenase-like protein